MRFPLLIGKNRRHFMKPCYTDCSYKSHTKKLHAGVQAKYINFAFMHAAILCTCNYLTGGLRKNLLTINKSPLIRRICLKLTVYRVCPPSAPSMAIKWNSPMRSAGIYLSILISVHIGYQVYQIAGSSSS